VIEFVGVSKLFRHGGGAKLLRSFVQDLWQRRKVGTFYALHDVSFRLDRGESLAIVGRNGAGKSTLLSLVAGLAQPTEGRVMVQGRVAALLDLSSGFHFELTGVENVRLNAALLGMTRKGTAQAFDEILSFADIGDFIHDPVRTYSTGMLMRLAFSVAINVNPDILVVDEVLAVGDQAFHAKCLDKIEQLKRAGRTLMFVSHSSPLVRKVCKRALWLDHGQLIMDGIVDEVLDAYAQQPVPQAPA